MGYLQLIGSIDHAKRVASSYGFKKTAGALETLANRVGAHSTQKDYPTTYRTWLDNDQEVIRAELGYELKLFTERVASAISACNGNNQLPGVIRKVALVNEYADTGQLVYTIKESEWRAAKDVGKLRTYTAVGSVVVVAAGFLFLVSNALLGSILLGVGFLIIYGLSKTFGLYKEQLKIFNHTLADDFLVKLGQAAYSIEREINAMEKQLKAWIQEISIPNNVARIAAEVEKENR
ncbi:MAG: hypothetical protein WCT31_03145 [Candidatus Micrarchaeia archaeon]|jgi:hypothetical protein